MRVVRTGQHEDLLYAIICINECPNSLCVGVKTSVIVGLVQNIIWIGCILAAKNDRQCGSWLQKMSVKMYAGC